MKKIVRITESELNDIVENSVKKILNEESTTFWGKELDPYTTFSGRLSKGLAKDYIKKHGDPKSVGDVLRYIRPDGNTGFQFYSETMFRDKTGCKAQTSITEDGILYCFIRYSTYEIYLSFIKYDFKKPLIVNLRLLYDKTPSNIKLF